MDQTPHAEGAPARGGAKLDLAGFGQLPSPSFPHSLDAMYGSGYKTHGDHNEQVTKPYEQSRASPISSVAPTLPPTSKPDRPPRPMNAWLLFRNAQVKELQSQNPEDRKAQGQLSKIIAELWKAATPETKRVYENMAKEKKEEHARQYPDYRYTPREKPAKKRRQNAIVPQAQPSNHASTSSAVNLDVPRRLSGQAPSLSPRNKHAPPPGFLPYAARPSGNASPLPPIDTSHVANTWQPLASLSTPGAYPLPHWHPSLGAPESASPSTGEDRQPYRNGGPVSAPPDFSGSRSISDHFMRQSLDIENRRRPLQSPTWPSASTVDPLQQSRNHLAGPISASASSERPSYLGYQTSTSSTPAEPVPTFEYNLYRATASSYATQHMPPSPPPTNSTAPMPLDPSSSMYTAQSLYQPQNDFQESSMFPSMPCMPNTNGDASFRHGNDSSTGSPVLPSWRNDQLSSRATPSYNSFDSHQEQTSMRQQQYYTQRPPAS